MIIAAFKYLMVRKYYGYSIYIHNFTRFDSVFLLKTLVELPNTQIKPVYRDGKILKVGPPFASQRGGLTAPPPPVGRGGPVTIKFDPPSPGGGGPSPSGGG
jgi:hypothetical protein